MASLKNLNYYLDIPRIKKEGDELLKSFSKGLSYKEGKYDTTLPSQNDVSQVFRSIGMVESFDTLNTVLTGKGSSLANKLSPIKNVVLSHYNDNYKVINNGLKILKNEIKISENNFNQHTSSLRGSQKQRYDPMKDETDKNAFCSAHLLELTRVLVDNYQVQLKNEIEDKNVNEGNLKSAKETEEMLSLPMKHMKILEPIFAKADSPRNILNVVKKCKTEDVYSKIITEKLNALGTNELINLNLLNTFEVKSVFGIFVNDIIKEANAIQGAVLNSEIAQEINKYRILKESSISKKQVGEITLPQL